MITLKKIKIKRQREQGIIINTEVPNAPDQIGDIISGNPKLKDTNDNLVVKFNSTKNKVTDGYWITLQDWTQCSLKCGRGASTLQRMCVPPKETGTPCSGPAILTRPCNVQPCPLIKELITFEKKKNFLTKTNR